MELLSLYFAYFLSFFKIGMFGFGGGYAMLSLIQHEVVEAHQWISVADFTDIVAISQTTPGPIAFNTATYIGYTATSQLGYSTGYSVLGSAVCTTAVSLPSVIFMTLVYFFIARFRNNLWLESVLSVLKPAVIGLIAAAALSLINERTFIDYNSWVIFGIVFFASMKKADPILLIILSGVAGFFLY